MRTSTLDTGGFGRTRRCSRLPLRLYKPMGLGSCADGPIAGDSPFGRTSSDISRSAFLTEKPLVPVSGALLNKFSDFITIRCV